MKLKIPQHIMFKLQAWRDIGDTEVTGFFVTEKDKFNEVIDAIIIKAKCSGASVDISAEAIESMYLDCAKNDIYPDQLQIWWHTHPGNSATPSALDETTFTELGQDRTKNIMYILANGGSEFAQISVTDRSSGYMLHKEIKVEHPFTEWQEFPSYDALKKEYEDNVIKHVATTYTYPSAYQYNGYHHRDWFSKNHSYSKKKETENSTTANDPLTSTDKEKDKIKAALDKLTVPELAYIEELHAMVESNGITADDADRLAVRAGHGFGFYTDIYAEENGFLDEDDTEYLLLEKLWIDAQRLDDFLETVRQLIDLGKIDQASANMYLTQNNFDVCYMSGEYFKV